MDYDRNKTFYWVELLGFQAFSVRATGLNKTNKEEYCPHFLFRAERFHFFYSFAVSYGID